MQEKHQEKKTLELVLNDAPSSEFGRKIHKMISGNIMETERPDFIIGDVGVEHFLVDLLFRHNEKRGAMSIERRSQTKIEKEYSCYGGDPEKIDEGIKSGKIPQAVEGLIKDRLYGVSKFQFDCFLKNFEKVFDNHYKNRNIYREQRETLGFLIEIPYECAPYVVWQKGSIKKLKINGVPIPKKMMNYIWEHDDLDFIILCARPFGAQNKIKRKDVSIIYIDVKKKKIYGNPLVFCDKFDYYYKLPETQFKLEVVSQNERDNSREDLLTNPEGKV